MIEWCPRLYGAAVDIIYKQGSILEAPEPYIVHGCNAQGRMGSGVAKVLMDRYPAVRDCYLEKHEQYRADGVPFLGTVHTVKTGGPHLIFNAITQEFYGYDGGLYVSYEALEQCMNTINEALAPGTEATGVPAHVAMPLIGCGLAGGHWPTVAEIVERASTHFQPVVYTLDGVIPGV